MAALIFSYLHAVIYFYNILAVRGRLNVDFWEAEIEPCDIVGYKVNDITFIIGLEVILKGAVDI